jgi:hypothetical protein
MKADYLTLANDRRVRILFNMNALGVVSRITGTQLIDLAKLKVDMDTIRTIAWCSATEGELADGKELQMTEAEFGRQMTMGGVIAFTAILKEQINGLDQKKNQQKGRLPKIFFRGNHS